jgi:hypothetical protein
MQSFLTYYTLSFLETTEYIITTYFFFHFSCLVSTSHSWLCLILYETMWLLQNIICSYVYVTSKLYLSIVQKQEKILCSEKMQNIIDINMWAKNPTKIIRKFLLSSRNTTRNSLIYKILHSLFLKNIISESYYYHKKWQKFSFHE